MQLTNMVLVWPKKRVLAVLAGVFIAVLGIGFAVYDGWLEDPYRQARKISGLDIPSSARVVHAEAEFHGITADGYRFYVFDLEPNFAPQSEVECHRLGYKFAPLASYTQMSLWGKEDYFNRYAVSCFHTDGPPTDWTLVLFQGNRLVVYFEIS